MVLTQIKHALSDLLPPAVAPPDRFGAVNRGAQVDAPPAERGGEFIRPILDTGACRGTDKARPIEGAGQHGGIAVTVGADGRRSLSGSPSYRQGQAHDTDAPLTRGDVTDDIAIQADRHCPAVPGVEGGDIAGDRVRRGHVFPHLVLSLSRIWSRVWR